MIKINPIKGIDHGKEPYDDFIDNMESMGLKLDNLGASYMGGVNTDKYDAPTKSTGVFGWVEQKVMITTDTVINSIEWRSAANGLHSLSVLDINGAVLNSTSATGVGWLKFILETPLPVQNGDVYRLRFAMPTPSNMYRTTNYLHEAPSWKALSNVAEGLSNSYDETQSIAINTKASTVKTIDIYGTKIGEFTHKPVIAIQGSIHGHEWESAYWVREFLRCVLQGHDGKDGKIGANRELFQKLREKFDFVSIPIANPGGYINNSRYARNGIDLNRNFDIDWYGFTGDSYELKGPSPFSEPESRASRDYLGGTRPFFFLDCHTWATHDIHGGYWGDPEDLRYSAFCRDVERSMQLLFNEPLNLNPVYDKLPHSPRWFASRKSKEGIYPLAFTVESHRKVPYEDRFFFGVNTMLIVCAHVLLWSENRKLPVNK